MFLWTNGCTAGPWEETCGFKLLHYDDDVLLGQALSCGAQPGAEPRPATHGRDFFFAEMHRSGRVRSRLPGVHVGGGRYTFAGWERLSPGPWNASLVLWATARRPLLNATAAGFDALLQAAYLWQLLRYVGYPQQVVLQEMLERNQTSAVGISSLAGGEAPAGGAPRCTAPGKGEWVRIAPGVVDCPPGICRGPLHPLYFNSTDNAVMDFHDVYVPYGCAYDMYTAEAAEACLAGRRIVLVGDSRAAELTSYLHMFLAGRGIKIDPATLMPFRIGLRALAAPRPPLQHLSPYLSSYDVVIISSELHDIAEFTSPASEFVGPYGFDPGPTREAVLSYINATDSYGCAPIDAVQAVRAKYRPVAQYLGALRDFVTSYLATVAQLERDGTLRARRVLWAFYGYRPHATPPCLPNQLERMLCLQHLEMAEVARAGMEPLDLATMAQVWPRQGAG
ncbi:hypothetical protein TSOC_006962 [Tetrabaena socialis]|uniref:Uncharacterized protein n=1 Tax=Tetrabaena socialis TaxID=47790 RepID=A0A2J8A2A8_9CHLO|nr:hypothetical protein TSOC_006962 [Tetrabaena socialis]|eukprot:PNH06661.1 hypothetical protein TSOC_006962 [Tetrabaena socialis]